MLKSYEILLNKDYYPPLSSDLGGGAIPNPPSDWTPASISSVPVHFWLRADLGITMNGSNIASWTDQKNGYIFSQGTASNQPSYSASDATFNNQSSITFDGSNDYLSNSLVAPTQGTPIWYWIIFKQITWSGTGFFVCFRETAPANDVMCALRGNTSTPNMTIVSAGISNGNNNNGATIGLMTRGIVSIVGSTSDALKLRQIVATGVQTHNLITCIYSTGVDLGVRTQSTLPFAGSYQNYAIAEIIATQGAPSSTELTQLETYGITRYGAIPFGAPVPIASVSVLGWWRSDLGITLNGSTVSTWADQSGNGYNFTNGNAATQPTYSASDANYGGKPSITFDGVDNWLNNSSFPNLPAPATTNLFIWWVARIGAGVVNAAFVFRLADSQLMAIYFPVSGGTVGMYNGVAANNNIGAGNGIVARGYALFTGSTNDTLKIKGTTTTGVSAGNTDPATGGATMGASSNGGSAYGNFSIVEMFISAGLPNAAELAALEAYGIARYGEEPFS